MSIKSPDLLIAAALTTLMLGNLASFSRPSLSAEEKAAAATKSKDVPRVARATIVMEYEDRPEILRTGVFQGVPGLKQTTALQIDDRKTLDELDAMFPNFRNHPKSDVAAGWESKYQIFFGLSDGRIIHLSASAHSDEGASWTQGDGDHSVKGNIDAFVAQLLKKLAAGRR